MRRKIFSVAVEKAQKRATGLRSISIILGLGKDLILKAFETEIEALNKRVNDYHETLTEHDPK